MDNLLGVSLIQFISKPLITVGLILLIIGVATVTLAKRITRVARQTNHIDNSDRLYIVLKIIGLLLMLAGFVCVGVDIILYILAKYGKI